MLESWAAAFPLLADAYEAKEAFYVLWELPDRQTAKEAYGAWRRNLSRELGPAFRELTTAMENWESEIFAYFEHPITNAYTESLNNLVRLTNRIGRGYSFAAIRAKLLYGVGWRVRPKPVLRRLARTQEREHVPKGQPAVPSLDRRAGEDYGASLPVLVRHLSRDAL